MKVPEIFPRCNAVVRKDERGKGAHRQSHPGGSYVCGAIATRRLPPECTRYGTAGLCESHYKVQLWAARMRAEEENRLVRHLESATRTFRVAGTGGAPW